MAVRRLANRPGQRREELIGKPVSDQKAHRDRDYRADEALAQLGQMLEQGHPAVVQAGTDAQRVGVLIDHDWLAGVSGGAGGGLEDGAGGGLVIGGLAIAVGGCRSPKGSSTASVSSRTTVLLANRSSRRILPTVRITSGSFSGGMMINATTRTTISSLIPTIQPL